MENIATVQAIIEARITDKEYDALVKEEARKLCDWIDTQVLERIYEEAIKKK